MSTRLRIGDLVRVRHREQIYTVLRTGLDTVLVVWAEVQLTVPMRHVERISAVDLLADIEP